MALNVTHNNEVTMKVTQVKNAMTRVMAECVKGDNLAVIVMAVSLLMVLVFAALGEQVFMAISGSVLLVALFTMLYGWLRE